ncbi:MAG: hypothetical protein GX050_01925 [Firmicutes bacterium]|nr:hypothetical protein [Bacillota bacterium]
MNRRLRRLLRGSLFGAVASVVISLGRRRMLSKRRKALLSKAVMALEQVGRLGFVQKWLSSRRRVR